VEISQKKSPKVIIGYPEEGGNSNRPLEHTPEPQPPVYEGNPFLFVFLGYLGYVPFGVCWNFLRETYPTISGTCPENSTMDSVDHGWGSLLGDVLFIGRKKGTVLYTQNRIHGTNGIFTSMNG